ncbi:hypothetical protein ACFLS9_01420 [Bacteroidota bacterium]
MGKNYNDDEIKKYKEEFKRRRSVRVGIFIFALVLLIGVTLLAFPSWELFGMPKLVWAPFFYIIMFGIIISIAIIWRCPACNGLLGDVFSTKFCPKCGFKFFE